MTNKWKAAFLGLLALDCLSLTVGFIAVKAESDRSVLHAYIHSEISDHENGATPYVDFSKIPSLAWERMYIFGPYSSCERIREALASPVFWLDCQIKGIESYENGSLLIFRTNAWTIEYVVHDGIFPEGFNDQGYPSGQARFALDERRRLIWVGN